MNKKSAFVFPGQGSQSVGMLKELAQLEPLIIKTYQVASDVLGFDLWNLVSRGPEEKLNQTEFAQPALLTASYALWRVWQTKSVAGPVFLAGHSLGEYSALVCSEALDFQVAVKLVAARGRLMQEAVPAGQGAMVAVVGLEDAMVEKVCVEAANNEVLEIANYNSIGQTVLAGEYKAAERAVLLAKKAGAKIAKILPVSVPSHCPLMRGAAKQLDELLKSVLIATPKIPVINNIDVAVCSDAEEIKKALVRQLSNPVQWVKTEQFLAAQGVEVFIECGPGKVLAGLHKRIIPAQPIYTLQTPSELAMALGI